MNQNAFEQLNLSPEVFRAINELGFTTATEIQTQSIPLIKSGYDVIGRSQTGTGKTLAFGVPAVELIDTELPKNNVQVLILCPTRELAMQACSELKKLSKYKPGVKIADIYGGAPMDRQIVKLKSGVNIVVGTPGRVMDHMRRKTLKLNNLKMIVLDEADEMLSMGFREDIETILKDAPEERQTILFSATMPPSIMELTKLYQKDPQLVEINKKKVTLDNISQFYCEVPMGRKMDALNLLLRYHNPNRALIFCNTKSMVDEIHNYLTGHGFNTEGLHGDMKQSQRTKVMDSFKSGRTSILIATDVAARGIHVDDVNYVFNYDIPQNVEYYVHRIGRAGRAGKLGTAITICSGRRQSEQLRMLSRVVKSQINYEAIPSLEDAKNNTITTNAQKIEEILKNNENLLYAEAVGDLVNKGYSPINIAAAALELHFGKPVVEVEDIVNDKSSFKKGFRSDEKLKKIAINIGREQRIAPNHIVGAITERCGLRGSEIGKIEIYDNKTVVAVPEEKIDETLSLMKGCVINGNKTITTLHADKRKSGDNRSNGKDYRKFPKRNTGRSNGNYNRKK